MGAYDILTGTQLCMAVAMIAYGFYFKKKRTCRVWYFSGPAWLIAIWSAVVLYYYSEYPFLTILCFLMGFFLGMGIGLWVKKRPAGTDLLQGTAAPPMPADEEGHAGLFDHLHRICLLPVRGLPFFFHYALLVL